MRIIFFSIFRLLTSQNDNDNNQYYNESWTKNDDD